MRPIDKGCFGSYHLFSQINFPDLIQELTQECFKSCHSLTEIELPQLMKQIDKA
jgi:hypothetical protein